MKQRGRSRTSVGAACVLAVAALTAVALARGPRDRGAAAWGAGPGEAPVVEQVFPPCTELEERLRAKETAARALIDRELTLLEAARRFRDLTGADARTLGALRTFHPAAASEDELFCLSVIDWVRHRPWDRPAAVAAEVARLEAELRGLRERGSWCFPG
jgi:hypothetical protein